MKVAIVVETFDRRVKDASRRNYLDETLANLKRAGVRSSKYLHSIDVISGEGFTRLQNAARTLRYGAAKDADFVLKIEDDIDFVDDFLESTVNWLLDHYHYNMPMYSLGGTFESYDKAKFMDGESTIFDPGTSFPTVRAALAKGKTHLDFTTRGFFGTQALLWERHVAEALTVWMGDDPKLWDGREFHRDRGADLLLQLWLRDVGVDGVRCPIPSFVQHIGNQSTLDRPELKFTQPFIQFPFAGRDWRYKKEGAMVNV